MLYLCEDNGLLLDEDMTTALRNQNPFLCR